MSDLFSNKIFITCLIIVGCIFLLYVILKFIGIVMINTDEVGIVEKWWSPKGSLKNHIIALQGEAGFQPDVLRAGIHLKSPLMYKIHKTKLITIVQGKIGYVFARDGEVLNTTQTLAKVVNCENFQDTRAFLQSGGQKGVQRAILREGTYAINLAEFIVVTEDRVYSIGKNDVDLKQINDVVSRIKSLDGFTPVIINGKDDSIGVVTVNDGPGLPNGVLIAPIVADTTSSEFYHNNFQDTEMFLKAGGLKGRQLQVLTDGTYFINRLFASVEFHPKTTINIGEVGIVVSYYGEQGEDLSGSEYKHGELVKTGCRGIWETALQPGKYALNPYATKIVKVPTTNVILKWISGQTGTHKLDENLKEVNLITKDAFEPSLPLTVVLHIDYKKASRVIQRFGDIKTLIEQSIDPMVAGYFKNVGQLMNLVELIQNRNEIQTRASKEMKDKFQNYDLDLEEVLIGTPTSSKNDTRIDTILEQLRDRQLAKERISTFEAAQKASEKEVELNRAKAAAAKQTELTSSELEISIRENEGKAQLQVAKQVAERTKTEADADLFKKQKEAEAHAYSMQKEAEARAFATEKEAEANAFAISKQAEANAKQISIVGEAEAGKIKMVGEAEADKEAKVGISKAIAAREQVNAYGGAQLKVMQDIMTSLAEALKVSKIDLVPKTFIASGDSNSKVPNALEDFVNLLLARMADEDFKPTELSAQAEKIKNDIYEKLSK